MQDEGTFFMLHKKFQIMEIFLDMTCNFFEKKVPNYGDISRHDLQKNMFFKTFRNSDNLHMNLHIYQKHSFL